MLGEPRVRLDEMFGAGKTLQPIFDFTRRQGRSQTIRDIAQMAQRARQVAFQYVGVEIRVDAAADRGQEIAIMVSAAAEVVELVTLRIECRAAAVAGHDDVAVAAFKNHSHVGVFVFMRVQSADFEDQRLVAVVVNDHLRVGRVARVLIAVTATIAEHGVAQAVDAQSPAAQVHLVNALVPQVAVAIRKLHVPIVVQISASQRGVLGRAKPQIVVDALGNRIVAQRSD